jgi:hypothetical protein
MQRDRRRDPYPWTWEPAAAAAAVAVLATVIGIQLGRALANLAAGAGWTWPATDTTTTTGPASPLGAAFWTSLLDVLGGDAGAGLQPQPAGRLAGPGLVWAGIAATELVVLAATSWGIASVYRRWGPGRMRGMATVAEAEQLLGVTRLRKVAGIVRPDLYGKHATAAVPTQRQASGAEEHDIELGRGLSRWLLPGQTSREGESS